MAKKSKLLSALDAHKGRNFELEHQKKLQKAANKRKEKQLKKTGEEEEEKKEDAGQLKDVTLLNGKEKSDTKKGTKSQRDVKKSNKRDEVNEDVEEEEEEDNDEEEEEVEEEAGAENEDEEEEEEEEDEDEEDIPLSDLSGDEATDVIPHQRLTINNSTAILSSLKRVTLINDQMPFSEHQTLTSTETMDVPDPNDDLNRELAFYKVCCAAAKTGRALLKKEGIPFSRPTDYFAEMVKDDEHMDKIKKKLYEEAASKKASADAKKQRDLKKFGKQVQIAKIQERHKEKRETLEKINELKRKRRGAGNGEAEESELFDVALEESSKSDSRRGGRGKDGEGSRSKRQKKDAKFGFGGKKRFAKSGDAISSGDLSSFSTSKMKGKKTGAAKRLGKGRRQARR
ncbi:Eukaryotic rRNA processing [Trichophyton interdigitale]|uniref:Eukaryotic rRNA processing n=1 Tax=Trichophyton interdigitale TaxID=101480 RepID=A0A9P4YMD7_9EURO|nr:Eukaryotic rRNA processing [Trichophyton interdigitale]KAF3899800.1 Eukaryotic rRNA processing [Trichophyton interdigitale]KAG8207717.1 Eukaryotic rRNA processing [Trichophyton interdigitale]